MSDLLPCPFCGGSADVAISERSSGKTCYRCECNYCESYTGLWCDEKQKTITAWNTRAQPTYNPETHLLIAREDVPECPSKYEISKIMTVLERDKVLFSQDIDRTVRALNIASLVAALLAEKGE